MDRASDGGALVVRMVLLSILLHIDCREQANVCISLVPTVTAAFVAHGLWVLKPF